MLKLSNDRNLYFNEIKKQTSKLPKIITKKINLRKKAKNKKTVEKNKRIKDPNSPFAVLEKLL